jgi:hypothetical protein
MFRPHARHLVLLLILSACRSEYAAVPSIEHAPEYQDPALLERAWALPVASLYRQGFRYQENGSVCGPTTAVDVLQTLGKPAGSPGDLMKRRDLGVLGFLPGGITLDDLAAVLRAEGAGEVTVERDLDLDHFRALLRTANDPARRLLVNLHRGPLFGRGGGHHSPIGGYLEDRDLVFVLDVNESYRPWLVPTARLFAAVDTVDGSTGKKRGLLVITPAAAVAAPAAP